MPDESLELIEGPQRNDSLIVVNIGDLTRATRITFPKEVTNTSSYIDTGEHFGCLFVIYELSNSVVAKHFSTKIVQPITTSERSRGNDHRQDSRVEFLGMFNKVRFFFVRSWKYNTHWTDDKLYKRYDLTKDELAFIDSTIRPMEANGE